MGSWCKRLLDLAALPNPVTVGCSGKKDGKTSKCFLNIMVSSRKIEGAYDLLENSHNIW